LQRAVLQLIDSFNQGGSELQAVQLTRLLCESDRFAVHLASLSPEGPLRASVEKLHLPEIPCFPLNSFYDANAVVQLRRFVSLLRRLKVDVIQTHDFYTNIFGITAAAIARVPVRIASMRETAGMRTGKQKQLQKAAFALANHVIGNSEAVRNRLIQDGMDPTKISVIYNGLDVKRLLTSRTREEVLREFGLPLTNERYITIVANMRHDVKDYPMFLRSAQIVRQTIPDAGFLLAGEGELTESLTDLAKELGVNHCTHFLGRCEKIAELLSVSEICVLSSKAEGFSNSILEYMAAGRPVVATDVGGAKEAIVEGETGYLVKSGDHVAMAKHLIDLLQQPELAQSMGQLGRERVEEKFSCEAQVRNTEALYDRLLSVRARR